MRLLVTGARGLLGLNLALEALDYHEVAGVDRGPLISAPFEIVRADLEVPGTIEQVLADLLPEAVIHCAAAADVDFCETHPDEARRINAELPGELAAACASRSIRLVHISTDAVFDGLKSGTYLETDEPNPGGVYATTKCLSERAVLRADPQAIVARVNFYGWSISGKRSLAEFFVQNLGAGHPVFGFTDVTFCPMFVGHLARILIAMLKSGLSGLFHVVGPESMSKFEFGRAIARRFGFDEELISPKLVDDFGLAARRSHNLALSVHKLSTSMDQTLPSFSTGLGLFHAQFLEGYPQRIAGFQQEGLGVDGDDSR